MEDIVLEAIFRQPFHSEGFRKLPALLFEIFNLLAKCLMLAFRFLNFIEIRNSTIEF